MINQIIEGVIQGVTEFLPISSSGHIVFLKKITGFSSDNLVGRIFGECRFLFVLIS